MVHLFSINCAKSRTMNVIITPWFIICNKATMPTSERSNTLNWIIIRSHGLRLCVDYQGP